MYKITSKNNLNAIIWDKESNAPLGKFTKGALKTNNKVDAEKFAKLGHKVDEQKRQTKKQAGYDDGQD